MITVEDYQSSTGGNLTEGQREYAAAAEAVYQKLQGNLSIDFMMVGFREAGLRFSESEISPNRPIRRASELRAMAVMPKPGYTKYPSHNRRRTLKRVPPKIEFVDQQATRDEYGLGFAPAAFADRRHRSWRKFDLLELPRQSCPQFAPCEYRPGAIGEQMAAAMNEVTEDSRLRSPIAGPMTVVRDDLYFKILVAKKVVYSFRLFDDECLELCEFEGRVEKNQEIGRLLPIRPITYWRALFDKGQPIFQRFPSVIDATNDAATMGLCSFALQELVDAAAGTTTLSEFMPRCYYEVPEDVVSSRRDRPEGWTPSAAFKSLMLHAVSPEGLSSEHALQLKMPEGTKFNRAEHFSTYRALYFTLPGGYQMAKYLPLCSVVLVEDGTQLTEDQPVADLILRSFYPTYASLTEVAMGDISKLEDMMFDSLMLRSGSRGYAGRSPAVAAIAADDHMVASATDCWLDLTPCFESGQVYDSRCVLSLPVPIIAGSQQAGFSYYGVYYDFSANRDSFSKSQSSASYEQSARRD